MTAHTTITSLGRRRSYRLATSISVALCLASGLVALSGSPASAVPKGELGSGAGSISHVPPDPPTNPCVPAPQILSFAPTASTIDSGTSTNLNWFIQVGDGCQVDLVIAAVPLNWNSVTWEKRVWAQSQALAVQPRFDTQYVLTLSWGDGGWIRSTPATVAVRLPIDPIHRCSSKGVCSDYIPDCSAFEPCHHTINIDDNSLAPLLVQALGTPNTTVNVKDGVELDLTPYWGGPISIKEGVQLLGGRVARPGKPYQPGPLLFVTGNPVGWNLSNWPNPLFRIEGDNVRFSGVRLEGPGSPPDDWRAKIIRPQCPLRPDDPDPGCAQGYTKAVQVGDGDLIHPINIEIDHNEIYNWNTAAVDIQCDGRVPDEQNPTPSPCADPRDHRDTEQGRIWDSFTSKMSSDSSGITYPSVSEPIYVHDNYFHDNFWPMQVLIYDQYHGGPYFGYGVVVGGSHALIERNVFDGHYHAIAGGNDHHTGYRAYRNLVLANGYKGNQQFDMHGDRWCHNGSRTDNAAECGLAGHDIDIRWNSFLWTGGPAIKVRGTPSLVWESGRPVGAVVKSNVFAIGFLGVVDAAETTGNGLLMGDLQNWRLPAAADANLVGVNSWDDYQHHSDQCDFDGDKKPDRLITTGQTWWFQSLDTSKGPTPWVYLTTQTLLVSDVVLVPSKSGGCDVFLR